jgi:hypothetical protein
MSWATAAALLLLLPKLVLLGSLNIPRAIKKQSQLRAIKRDGFYILQHTGADMVGLCFAALAFVSLQFALDSGVNRTWRSVTVIVLLIVGVGGGWFMFMLLHLKLTNLITAPGRPTDIAHNAGFASVPMFSPRNKTTVQWVGIILATLRGFGFRSFGYFIRKFNAMATLYIR